MWGVLLGTMKSCASSVHLVSFAVQSLKAYGKRFVTFKVKSEKTIGYWLAWLFFIWA